MKLRNKETGEIGNLITICAQTRVYVNRKSEKAYNSLAELEAEWEDVPEEPKKYWFIDAYGNIVQNEITKHYGDEYTDMADAYENQKQIGNYFETEEEAEKAVERLKAWKRLENKGLKFGDFECDFKEGKGTLYFEIDKFEFNYDDFDLLFSQEDD